MTQPPVALLLGQMEDWLRRISSDEEVVELALELECEPDYRTIMTALTQLEAIGEDDKIRRLHQMFL